MQSVFVEFPRAGEAALRSEDVGPPGDDEIQCQAVVSMISAGTELWCYRGEFDTGTNWAGWVKHPFRPGYSMAAIVLDVGAKVKGFRQGDRVVAWAPHQQFFNAAAAIARVIPDSVQDEEAAWVPLACVAAAAADRANLRFGETVGVVGLGLVGQLVCQWIDLAGAGRIIAIDPDALRLELASTHGATDLVNLRADEAIASVRDLTDGAMLDVVFDTTGFGPVLASAVQMSRRLGRVVLVGDTPTPSRQPLGPGVVSESIAILGIHGSLFSTKAKPEITDLFFRQVAKGRIDVRSMISERLSPTEAPAVYDRLASGPPPLGAIYFDWRKLDEAQAIPATTAEAGMSQ